jgi:hypothetical protein
MAPSIRFMRAGFAAVVVASLVLAVGPAALAAPSNDAFASAQAISGESGNTGTNNQGATKESGEPNHAGNAGGASVWFQWTAPSSKLFTFTTAGSSFNTLLGIYQGTSVSSLTEVASNDDRVTCSNCYDQSSTVRFLATAGQVYDIAVDGYGGAAGFADLTWTPAPSNDDFPGQTITGPLGSTNGTTVGATKQTGEPSVYDDATYSVWYSWTPSVSQTAEFRAPATYHYSMVTVYTGSNVGSLTYVAGTGCCIDNQPVEFIAQAGTTYHIAVNAFDGGYSYSPTGDFTLQWGNDAFSDAIYLLNFGFDYSGTLPFTNVGATKEPGEPNHAGNAGGASLWYEWYALATGPVRVDTDGSNFDTLLAVYTSWYGPAVASDDDHDGLQTSAVSFQAIKGTHYYIAVDGHGGATGSGVLNLQMGGAAVYSVIVTKAGTGSGQVSSSPGGITCGPTCSASFDEGTVVTLTASPNAGSAFIGWSGAGCSGTGTCQVTMDAPTSVTATFTPVSYSMTVKKSGSGTGTVTSSPSGITCGSTCSASFNVGAVVTLTATADPSSSFVGWSGGGCSGTGTCQVTMSNNKSVTAAFSLSTTYQLSVTTAGTGSGTVTSSPAGITCGATCSANFAAGTQVTLTATPGTGSSFGGWSGACSGTGTCQVTMDAAKSVNATFSAATYQLGVTKAGTGSGKVSSSPAGITCGATCLASFAGGTVVTLSAAPVSGSAFTGWSGAGCSGTGTCQVTMDAAKSVTATFTRVTLTLTAKKTGTGTGTVTSSPSGITCGSTCSASFNTGAVVTLTATPDPSSTFVGWSGGGCSGTGTCQVTMSNNKSVTAAFSLSTTYQLSVTKAGTGSGTVTSSPAGITCGATCSANFAFGSQVTLTATPGTGSSFSGWSGAGCAGTGTCLVTMDAAKSVTATFTPAATTTEESDPGVQFDGWVGFTDAAANGGAYRASKTAKDTSKFVFSGTAVTWISRSGPNRGMASVTIDGVSVGTFDLYASTAGSFSQTFSGLAAGSHAIVVKALGTKNASSTDTWVPIDAFTVGSTTTQESSPSVRFGDWVGQSNTGASGGTYRINGTAARQVTFSFTGTAIDWVTATGPAYGQAQVTIDGVSKGTVDLYQASAQWQVLQSYTGLSSGPHTIVVKVTGTKNTSSTGTGVVVDAFVVHP